MSLKIGKEVLEFKRSALQERLAQLTDEQRQKFKQIWPEPIAEDDLISAIDLCDRTIRKNVAGRSTPGDERQG